ncbi:MAG: prepilin peptidase [Planctomycetota bacterium]
MVHLSVPALVFPMCLLLTAVVTDVLWRKVHNLVTIPLILSGVIHHAVESGMPGLLISGAAVVVAIGLLIVPFLLGGLGAGDVKLLAGIGAWTLVLDVIWVFVIAGLLLGVLSFWQRRLDFSRLVGSPRLVPNGLEVLRNPSRRRVTTWEGEAPAEPSHAGPFNETPPVCLRGGAAWCGVCGRDSAQRELRPLRSALCRTVGATGLPAWLGERSRPGMVPFAVLLVIGVVVRFCVTCGSGELSTVLEMQV